MKALFLLLALFFFLPVNTKAQFLNEYRWKSRLVLVFTPSPEAPLFIRQMKLFQAAQEDLKDRNVVLIMLTPAGKHENTGAFLNQESSKQYFDYFRVDPLQLETILVGLDGGEKLRKTNQITTPSVIFSTIDQMPMRRQEVRRKTRQNSQIDGGK